MAKINLNKGKDSDRKVVGMTGGSYEDMIKQRKKMMPQMQKTIEELFDNWSGEVFAIIKVKEDENGEPQGVDLVMSGAGTPESQIALSKGLDEASNEAIKLLAEGVASLDDPKDMMRAIKEVVSLLNGNKEDK